MSLIKKNKPKYKKFIGFEHHISASGVDQREKPDNISSYTKNGYGDLVVMSIETFDAMLEDRELDAAIAEAEAEYTSDNQLVDAREALSKLKRKHFGK